MSKHDVPTLRPRWVVGRTIVEVIMRAQSDGRGGTTYNPTFVLDNGARIFFTVDETEQAEYGVHPYYVRPE